VAVKKNRYVKRKSCQKCHRQKEKYEVPKQKSHCTLVPQYASQCYEGAKCKTVKQKHCTPYTVSEVAYRERRTCYWPKLQHVDHFCTRRSDDDVLLDAGTEFREDVEYQGVELLDKIDFKSVFPADYVGSPNETLPAVEAAGIGQPLPLPVDESPQDTGNIDYTDEQRETESPANKNAFLSEKSIGSSAEMSPTDTGSTMIGYMSRDGSRRDWSPPLSPAPLRQKDQAEASSSAPAERDDWAANSGGGFMAAANSGGGGFMPDAIASFFQSQMSQGFRDLRRLDMEEEERPSAGSKARLEEPGPSANSSLGSQQLWGRLV
jgi:hypothetical protein